MGRASAGMVALLQSDRLQFLRGFRHRCSGTCPMHSHAAMELVYHFSGAGEEWGEDGVRVPFTEGTVSVHPPGCMHGQRMRSDGEDICLHVQGPERMPSGLERSLLGLALNDLLIREQFLALYQPPAVDGLQLAMRHHLVRAVVARVVALATTRTPVRDPVDRAQRYLREHFRELGSLDEVAHGIGIGPDHLRHVFKRRTGTSLLDYLTAVRVGRARDLLEHSALPVAEIARQCGYASHRHLDVVFRRAQGCTPRHYRITAAQERMPR